MPVEDGKAAYELKDYVLAFRLWLPFAKRGDAEVQYDLGSMYFHGLYAALEAVKNGTGERKTGGGTQAHPAPSAEVTEAHLKTRYMGRRPVAVSLGQRTPDSGS